MMAKVECKRDKEQINLVQRSSVTANVSCTIGYSMHAVMMQCVLFIIFLLLLAPNLSSAALPTVETLPPISSHLNLPSGVAVGGDEKIYVASSIQHWVRLFSKSGQYQSSIVGLDKPAAVAVDTTGLIYIGNAGRGNVEVYGPDRLLIGKLGLGDGEFRVPVGIAVDSADLIYVVDSRANRVSIYNADRTFKSSFGSAGTGNGQFQTPTAIAINEATSEILISDLVALSTSARVQVFDLNGMFLRSFITTGMNDQGETVAFLRPYGIAVDTLGRIYVTDGYQNVVTVYGTQGNYLGKLFDSNRPLRNPQGIAFAPGTSRLFIASLNTHTVETLGIDNVYGDMAVSPQSHDFGAVTVNDVSTSQSFALSNSGSGGLAVGSITLTGADASEFSIAPNSCADKTLAPTASCTLEVQFRPLATGSKSASLSIASDDLYAPVMDVALSGSADPQQYRLTVSKGGTGSGTVSASGINCGTTCVADYADGTVVTLSASANGDSTFVGWSGGGCSGITTCAATMGQAIAVVATFNLNPPPPVTYSITASAGSNGSISPAGTVTHNAGATVAFSITADADYSISDVLVDGVSVGAVGSYSFDSLGADHTIAAEFTANAQSLQLSSVEMGAVSVGDQWKPVAFTNTFTDPVVVIKPASLNDSSPAVVRVRNVNAQGFEVRIQEWDYLILTGNDAAHAEEQVGYIVMERGSYALTDGTRIEAGRFNTNATTNFGSVGFAHSFMVPPIVMSSVVTYNEDMAVIGRMGNVDATGFGYMLQEQGYGSPEHVTESVSFIALEPSQGSQDGISFEVGTVNDVPTQQTRAVDFTGSYLSQPLFIADLQTTNGDTVNLRWSDKSATGVSILLDQERSSSTMSSILTGLPPVPPTPSTEGVGYLILWSADMQSHSLTVEKSGQGSGLVQAQGIDCGASCSTSYGHGTSVTLTAVADSGSLFAGWSGGCSGTAECVVTMDQAVTVTATFDLVQAPLVTYTITANPGLNGTITPPGAQSVDAGSSLIYNIAADAGYHIVNVTVDGTSQDAVASYEFVNIDANHTIAALFDVDEIPSVTYTITASAGSNGTISPAGEQVVNAGATPTYSITADTGYHIADVTVDGESVGVKASYQFPALGRNRSISAIFAVDMWPLTVEKSGSGSGLVQTQAQDIDCGATCSHTYSNGTEVTLTAVAESGSRFVGWSGGGCSGTTSCTVTMDQAITVTAQFDVITYTITASAGSNGSITSQCEQVVDAGTSCIYTITADAGYHTANVTVDGVLRGTIDTYEFPYLNIDHEISATFAVNMPLLTVGKAGQGGGLVQTQAQDIDCGTSCSSSYSYGTEVTLTAVAESGSLFAGWSDGGCSGTAECVVTMDQAITVTARFDVITYTITATAGLNGSITPPGETVVNEGVTQSYEIVADAGYRIDTVTVDDKPQAPDGGYEFSNIGANHTISATFVPDIFKLTDITTGEVRVSHTWEHVVLDRYYADPVVVAKPASRNDDAPAVVRIRNVSTLGFDIKIQEWGYLDGVHDAEELVNYIVMESGPHVLSDRTLIEAGWFEASNTYAFDAVQFNRPKRVPPIVVSSVVSYNEEDAVIGRIKEIDEGGFQYMLQEQADQVDSTAGHATETVSYIAWEPSTGRQDGVSFEASCVGEAETQQFIEVGFLGGYTEPPLFVADLQTADSSDAANLRWKDKNKGDVRVLIDQEKSPRTTEFTSSSAEEIGYLVLSEQAAPCKSVDDCDGDGLTDDEERNKYGTNPYLANTDGDFWDDGKEVAYWGVRWNRDLDGDGLINLLDYDSDGDGGGEYDGSAFASSKAVKTRGSRGCRSIAAVPKKGVNKESDRKQRAFEKRRGFKARNHSFEQRKGWARKGNTGFQRPARSFDQRKDFD